MNTFQDEIIIRIRSGKGGGGIISFHREKFMPKGGPDGGDGGRGGHVFFKATSNVNTLGDYRTHKIYKAQNGQDGSNNKCSGKKGDDLYLEVPIGTIIYDEDKGIIHDFKKEESFCVLHGGHGGKGNQHFASPANQTPRKAYPGGASRELTVKLVIKVIADIGLVGYPNAGKSTFLSVVTKANPKIAPYPFTTIKPNLGTFSYDGKKYYIIADIPGLIDGASEGKGLGISFLKHIERTKILLFILNGEQEDFDYEYHSLIYEITKYNPEILEKKRIIGISKSDLQYNRERAEEFLKKREEEGISGFYFSSMIRENLTELLKKLSEYCNEVEEKQISENRDL